MDALLVAINSKYIHPAMGLFQIYANAKYPVRIKEFTIKDDLKDIISFINNDDSKVLLLSCYIWNINIIKEILPSIKNKIISLGGPEASFYSELLYEDNVSYITKGEGEDTFNELLDFLTNKRPLSEVSNTFYLEDGMIKYTFDALPNLNNIKHDLSLIKDFSNRVCYIESSRGCFYNCTYCLASTEKPVRYFPLDEVLANIKFLLDNNAKTIKFLDRSFGVKKEYIDTILKFILDHDNGISSFQFEVNGDSIASSTLELLNNMRKKSIRLEIGIQSTNPKTIKAIARTQNFEKLKANIISLKDNVVIHTDLIAGLPYETLESFKKSFNDTFMLFTEELQLGFLKELKGTVLSLTKDLYDYEFMDVGPYEVLSNKFITNDELKEIKKVEIIVDKYYNYGYFKNTMDYLFNTLNLDPFETFRFVYDDMNIDIYKYQFDELTRYFYQSLSKLVLDKDMLLFVIKEDYLTRLKIKPKIWWSPGITREERKEIYEEFSSLYNLSVLELYKYGHLEKNGLDYMLINYKDNKVYKLSKKEAPSEK